jgi:hypothetical protein
MQKTIAMGPIDGQLFSFAFGVSLGKKFRRSDWRSARSKLGFGGGQHSFSRVVVNIHFQEWGPTFISKSGRVVQSTSSALVIEIASL